MKLQLLLLLVLAGITLVFAEMDYIECATNCETMEGIWACEYSYCALYDMAAYNAMTKQQQCAFDCIWNYRWCKSGVYSTSSEYYETPGTAFRAEKEATCDKIYMKCMAANEINAEYSQLDDYCRKKETDCYNALFEKYCRPVQAACVAKCDGSKPPEQPAEEKKPCYGATTLENYCNSYCKAKLGKDCAFIAYVQWKDTIMDCSCNCPYGGETYYKIDCAKPVPAAQPPEDKCKGVECPDKCENGVMYTFGSCDQGTGKCTYKEEQCLRGCEDSTKCKPVSMSGEVFYYDATGKKVPLKFVKVEITSVKGTRTVAYGHLVTDENGKFTWNDPMAFQIGNRIIVNIKFEESKGRFFLVENNPNFPLELVYEKDIQVSDPRLSNYQMDLTSHNVQKISDAAKVYVTVQKAVDYKENVLKITPTTRCRIRVHNPQGNMHWYESDATGGDNVGLYLLPLSSSFTSSYIEDTVYHEYCHHIQDEMYKAPPQFSGVDHGGYYNNPDTGWGLLEGWAEYCAWEMKNYYKDNPDYDLYRIRGVAFDLELNYQIREKAFRVTNKYSMPNMMEEMAIASLLIDLRDSPQSRGGMDDDFITIPTSTLWDAYTKSRDFGDGKGVRHVQTLRDLYIALQASGYKPLLDYYDKERGLTQLDEVFRIHGAYQDLNSNGVWDMGEPFGYSGNGFTTSDYRTDLEAINGSEVIFDIRDASGNQITKGIMAHVDVKFSDGNAYRSYSYDVPLSEGRVNVPYPPRGYDATITMYAYQAGTGNRAPNTFTITTKEFYDQVDGSKPIGTYSAVVPLSKDIHCSADYECVYSGQGLSCKNGLCSPQPPAASRCSTSGDCGQEYVCQGQECTGLDKPPAMPTCLVLPVLVGLAVFGSAAAKSASKKN